MVRGAAKAVLCVAAILASACFYPSTVHAEEPIKLSAEQLDTIYNSPGAVSFGNGALTIVEFFDYQCSYCKADEEILDRILQENADIRVVYVDFPKLGPMSTTAAMTALAVLQQGTDKYWKFRNILMNKNMHVSDETIAEAAEDTGVDIDRMQRDVADPFAQEEVQNNVDVGHNVGANVTPTFIVGGYLFPGFHTYDEFQEMIATARASSAN